MLTISYDGTAYHGWQVQPNAETVQSTLQDALEKLLSVRPAVTGCSRTDAGVHAREFCCHLISDDKFPDNAFLKGLNSLLPDDITVVGCKTVSDNFHARYDCAGKRYSYGFYSGTKNPFDERYFLHLEKMPDVDLMNEFCKTIIGTHDFFGFSASGRSVEDTVRTVTECKVISENGKLYFKISANGFLYNMVRILAGTALAVGYGRLKVSCANNVFELKDRSLAGDTLPAKGLFLEKVFYETW